MSALSELVGLVKHKRLQIEQLEEEIAPLEAVIKLLEKESDELKELRRKVALFNPADTSVSQLSKGVISEPLDPAPAPPEAEPVPPETEPVPPSPKPQPRPRKRSAELLPLLTRPMTREEIKAILPDGWTANDMSTCLYNGVKAGKVICDRSELPYKYSIKA